MDGLDDLPENKVLPPPPPTPKEEQPGKKRKTRPSDEDYNTSDIRSEGIQRMLRTPPKPGDAMRRLEDASGIRRRGIGPPRAGSKRNNLENRNARQRNMEDADHPTCYMCKCEIRDESDNWIVVDTSFCRFLVCETCCDENSGAYEESEEEDIDMSDMKNALEETTMEDSSSESSSDEES